jgi:signal transduction histidine kinase
MSTAVQRAREHEAIVEVAPRPSVLVNLAAVVVAAAAMAISIGAARAQDDHLASAAAVLVSFAALCTIVVAVARSHEPLWLWLGAATLLGAGALAAPKLAGVVPLAVAGLGIALPDGSIRLRAGRVLLGLSAIVAVPFAIVAATADTLSATLLVVESAVLGLFAVIAYTLRCRRGGAVDRARLQWVGWGVVVSCALALAIALMHALVGWPDGLGAPIIIGGVFVPLSIALSSFDRIALRVDRLLVRTIEVGGLIVLVGFVYVVVVLGFGDAPTDTGRRVLGLSMVAAAIAALLFVPARNWLEEAANRRVYGERRAPDEPLQTFGARMSRAIPLDELLLQLAESLKKSMRLSRAEVWTGAEGVLDLAAAVPYREPTRVRMTAEEVDVVARARVSGNAWIQVWLPALLAQHPDQTLRIAPLVHSGELLGVIVCAREPDQQPFNDEEERVLQELARQVALALHNSALDTALQASLDELRIANEELRASRSRIVAASDQSRRQIERNLHDGAQQHLVALAVKLGLARQLIESDPATLNTMLEELRGDVQTTLTELRELAHGIYPPLLMDRGLREALVAAANRAVLPADVEADVGRYPADMEAAVYFCCLEALQNAGKHAGEGATITINVDADDHELRFSVVDTGAGFDMNSGAVRGHGFVNMADRLGAIGGRLDVDSEPGAGTRIAGVIPLTVQTEDRPSQS